MKRLFFLLSLVMVLASCGKRSGYFKIDGHLLNLNQGEFYVYSPDGVLAKIDTIKVEGGRFAYETPCSGHGTIAIVFPNFSELPVFAAPGKSVTISGDATHLKEIEVKGTDENKLMTNFRQRIAKASPPEVRKAAAQFVTDNAESLAAIYVLRHYFVADSKADLTETARLAAIVHKAQPKNGDLARLEKHIKIAKTGTVGSQMPQFTAQDIKGRTVTAADTRGKVTVVFTWASWSYESRNMMNRLKSLINEHKNSLALIAICLDASRGECSVTLRSDSTATRNICDEMMFDSPLLETFALTDVPDNIIYNAQGRIIERGLKTEELERRLKPLIE